MAETTEEMPELALEPEKMFGNWHSAIKICGLVAFCTVVYAYLHLYIRTYIMKTMRLEQIGVMVLETEKMLQNLYDMDQNLEDDLEELNDFYSD